MYNEIYGTYYYMMQQILNKAGDGSITINDINHIVDKHGFAESNLYFTPQVIAQDGSGYNLLSKRQSGYQSILNDNPYVPITYQQKRLIKVMLGDQRVRLFISEKELKRLEFLLMDIPPLYDLNDIVIKETAYDGDPYDDTAYKERFGIVLQAIKKNKMLKIVFNTSRGYRKTVTVAPYKIEYSVRDDKFRLCGVSLHNHHMSRYIKLNIARMIQIIQLDSHVDVDFEYFISQKYLKEPIVIEVSDLRNGFERIFIGLSNYKRTSVYNDQTHKCLMKIHCMDDDVQELLIVIMSFGPAVKVIGPPEFKEKYQERIRRQMQMFKAEE